jgi:aldehyde dehydrogenase (NAD+)
MSVTDEITPLLERLGVRKDQITGGSLAVHSPLTGECVARLRTTSAAEATATIDKAHAAFLEWRQVPAPRRGELV